jgi:prohibitin 1
MIFSLSLVGAVVGAWFWRSLRRGQSESRTALACGLAALAFLGIALAQTYTAIPAGHVGIVDTFGEVSPTTLKSGLQLMNPLARVAKMSIKTQELKASLEVPSKEGLTVSLDASVQFRLDPDKAYEIYKDVGDDYVAVLVDPQFRSVCGTVTAEYDATALYTSQRARAGQRITEQLRQKLEPRGITVQDVRFQSLTLPKRVVTAIEERLNIEVQSQLAIEKEQQEAQRRRIEAQGLADSQRIIAQSLNEQLLRWKGIEATEKLAESNNAKVVVIGSSKDGLPVILGSQ